MVSPWFLGIARFRKKGKRGAQFWRAHEQRNCLGGGEGQRADFLPRGNRLGRRVSLIIVQPESPTPLAVDLRSSLLYPPLFVITLVNGTQDDCANPPSRTLHLSSFVFCPCTLGSKAKAASRNEQSQPALGRLAALKCLGRSETQSQAAQTAAASSA